MRLKARLHRNAAIGMALIFIGAGQSGASENIQTKNNNTLQPGVRGINSQLSAAGPNAMARTTYKTSGYGWVIVSGKDTTIGRMTFRAGKTGLAVYKARGTCKIAQWSTGLEMAVQVRNAKDAPFDGWDWTYYGYLSVPPGSGANFDVPWTAEYRRPVTLDQIYNIVVAAKIYQDQPYGSCFGSLEMEIR